jgi:hypothetical protein
MRSTSAASGAHAERSELAGHESGQDHMAIYLHNGVEYIVGHDRQRSRPESLRSTSTTATWPRSSPTSCDNSKARIVARTTTRFAPTLAEVHPRP